MRYRQAYSISVLLMHRCLAMASFLFLLPAVVFADAWRAPMYDIGIPNRVVAVDKGRQMFHLYERKSPLALKYTFSCATGQVEGDKRVVNDLRTPEGVYFVEYKISSGLDFKEYGGIAYTLNYPNPVDRLRGKTGHGIWIHSKGHGIVPTRGCIAIGLKEIDEVGPLLTPGTAVVLAGHVPTESIPLRDDGTARHLRGRMDQWTRAWAGRSRRLFDFYDPDAYSKSMPESFAAFRANKERLFKRFSWLNIFNREVHVMEGPGYWVTWSEQFYRAPNLSTEGVRRLYWQRGEDDQFRIVGMEWLPRNVGMQAAYLKGQLVAAVEKSVSDAGSEAPVPPPLSMPETEDETPLVPAPASVSEQPQALARLDSPPSAPAAPASPRGAASPVPAARPPDEAVLRRVAARMEAWSAAWQERSPEFFNFYDQRRYGTLKDISRQDSFSALKADMTRRFRAPWIEIFQRPVRASVQGDYIVTFAEQWLREPKRPPAQGLRRLYWRKDSERSGDAPDAYRIVASQWEPGDHGMQAEYLEAVTPMVSAMVEEWRAAWEAGDLERYMAFYAPEARQPGKDRAAIREHKARLWAAAPPARVVLAGLRVQVDSVGLRVDMAQTYRDVAGRSDKGVKTLLLRPQDGLWRIAREEWSASAGAGETP